MQVEHCGLYFGRDQIKTAEKHRNAEPFKMAWQALNQPAFEHDALAVAQNYGLRYRFVGDSDNISALPVLDAAMNEYDSSLPYLPMLMRTVTIAQCFEMLRDHPDMSAARTAQWLEWFEAQVSALNQPPEDAVLVEHIWLALLNMAVGVVLERETLFDAGAAGFRQVIDEEVRPQGHMPRVVEGEGGFEAGLIATQGMVLMAEVARQVGVDLWSYSNRGVSVVTAALHPLYYFYFPETWPWGETLEMDATKLTFKRHAGFVEMLHYHVAPLHIGRPAKAITPVLRDIRPIFDLYGGGLTTLTHGVAPRRGLFG